MLFWGLATLIMAREFGAASYRFSTGHPDVDLAPGYFELAYTAGAIVSVVLGSGFIFSGIFGFRGADWPRVVSWLLGGFALPFIYAAYWKFGDPYIFVGSGSSAWAAEMRILTPWRYSGWYHDATLVSGFLVSAFLPCGIALLLILLLLPRGT
jgi:hypothetical protein